MCLSSYLYIGILLLITPSLQNKQLQTTWKNKRNTYLKSLSFLPPDRHILRMWSSSIPSTCYNNVCMCRVTSHIHVFVHETLRRYLLVKKKKRNRKVNCCRFFNLYKNLFKVLLISYSVIFFRITYGSANKLWRYKTGRYRKRDLTTIVIYEGELYFVLS